MIPKIIHWCWLGGGPLPEKIAHCIDSWKKAMPDYQIKCWTTKEFDVNSIPFVKTAFERKRWAFCADYIRAYALYAEGGIYLDSDVQVLKPFDCFLDARCVLPIELNHAPSTATHLPIEEIRAKYERNGCALPQDADFRPGIGVQAAILMGEKGHPYFKKVMAYYEAQTAAPVGNNLDDILIAPTVYARMALDYGFRYADEGQMLHEGIRVIPSSIMCVANYIGPAAVAVHLENHSWIELSIGQCVYAKLAQNKLLRRAIRAVREHSIFNGLYRLLRRFVWGK